MTLGVTELVICRKMFQMFPKDKARELNQIRRGKVKWVNSFRNSVNSIYFH